MDCLLISFVDHILQRYEAGLPRDKITLEKLSVGGNVGNPVLRILSLIDTLHFACKVVPPDRSFLQRMTALTKELIEPHCHIRLKNGFREDLRMWKQLIDNWNGTNMSTNEA